MKQKTNPIADSLDDIKTLRNNGYSVYASLIAGGEGGILFEITNPFGDEFNVVKEHENSYVIYKIELGFSVASIKTNTLVDAVIENEYGLTEKIIDNRNGCGQVPWNIDVDYRGIKVMMKPSTFLDIAAPIGHSQSTEYFIDHFKNKGTIGAPFLSINIPEEWRNGNFSKQAHCCGHEGRNRMLAIQEYFGDRPIEVHIFPSGAFNRASHLSTEIIEKLQEGVLRESEDVLVENIYQNFTELKKHTNTKYFNI